MFQKPLSILTAYSHYIYSCIIYVRDNQSESKYENYYNTPNKGTLRVERRRVELSIKKTTYAGNKFLHIIPPPIKNEGKASIYKKSLNDF